MSIRMKNILLLISFMIVLSLAFDIAAGTLRNSTFQTHSKQPINAPLAMAIGQDYAPQMLLDVAGNPAGISVKIWKRWISDLKKLSIAICKDRLDFIPIINKTLDSIENDAHDSIYDKWVAIRFDQGVDWELIGHILFFLMAVLIMIFIWNIHLKKAEKELKESEEKFSKTFQSAPLMYTITSIDDGRFIDVNDAFVSLTGYTRDTAIGSTSTEIGLAQLKDRNRVLDILRADGRVQNLELILNRADGSQMICLCSAEIVEIKDQKRLLSTAIDITDRKEAETLLRESETRYRSVLETINDGVILQSASSKILTWNKGAEIIFEISAKEAIGRTPENHDWQMIREDGLKYEGKEHPFMRTLQTGKPCKNEIIGVYQPSGELRWINLNTSPLYRADEVKPYAVVTSFTDITEIKKKKDKSQMYLDATTDGVWSWNFKTNTLFFSSKYYEMLGYAPDAFPADYDHWVDLIHPDDRKKALTAAAEYLQTKSDIYENEFRLRTAAGDYRWIRARAKVVEKDAEGEAVLMVGNHEDITERKQSDLALRESEEKFRNFTEQSLVGFYIAQDGLFKYVNPKFAEIFGYTADECIGMYFRRLVHAEDVAKVEEQVRRRVAGEIDTVQYTFRGVKKTGEIIHLSIYGSSLIYQGRPAAIGTMLDITKNLEMEKRVAQSQRMEAIGTLAGGIAHDFNNILFPIIGYTEMLKEDIPVDCSSHDHLEEIYHAALRARDLVKQILAFSRQTDQELMPIQLQPIIKEALKLLRASIPTLIDIQQNIDPACGIITADPTQLHQIIMNLTTNAYHAMEESGGRLTVTLQQVRLEEDSAVFPEMTPGEYALLTVSDTGIGIPKDLLEKIFDPYFTTKKESKGTGLGLSIVHGIVKGYKGDIRIYSEPGKGAEVRVYLPIVKTNAEKKDIEQTLIPGGAERLLLVDDEAPIVRMEKQMLERLGYRITTRTGSVEALEAFKANPDDYDLIITDMNMPNMTGVRLASEIRKIRPDAPIIICTGFSEQINEKQCKALGIQGYVMKPIIKRDIAETIRKVIDKNEDLSGKCKNL